MSTLLQLAGVVVVWLMGHVPAGVWLVLGLVLASKLFRRGPLLAGLGLAIGFRGVRGATRASHANPLMALVVVVVGAAALGHALGLGDGGPASASTAAANVPASGTGASLVVEVGYNAGWRGSTLAQAGAYAYIESGFRPTAVSSTGCEGLWQICPPPADAFDPAANARHAFAKWRACHGGSFSCDWTPYDGGPSNPGWATGYALAQQAMAALPNGGQ